MPAEQPVFGKDTSFSFSLALSLSFFHPCLTLYLCWRRKPVSTTSIVTLFFLVFLSTHSRSLQLLLDKYLDAGEGANLSLCLHLEGTVSETDFKAAEVSLELPPEYFTSGTTALGFASPSPPSSR